VTDAAPKILLVDDDDVERMMAQETMQRGESEGVIASKISDGLVIVAFFAVGVMLLPILLLASLFPIGNRSDKLPTRT
jgi:hypothetical protein